MANSNFCTECGQRLDAGVKFCPNCGNAISAEAATKEPPSNVYTPDYQPNDIPNNTPNYAPNYQQNYQPNYQPNYPPNYAPNYQPNYAPNYAPNYTPYYTPGFSTRINDPQIKSALKKNRRTSRIFLLICLPVPIIAACIYALKTQEMELGQALIYGAVISGIILIINILSGMSHSAKHSYEAVVIDKKTQFRRKDNTTVYETIVRTSDGHKKVIEETSHMPRSAYEYLCVGDRFRYHPQLAYPYEKYDKSKDGFIYCACCMTKNELSEDRCQKCGVPLLK